MLVIYVTSASLLGRSSLPFSLLLWLSREFCHTTQEIVIPNKIDCGNIINCFQIHGFRNCERGQAVSFLGIYVSNFQYSVCVVIEHGNREV